MQRNVILALALTALLSALVGWSDRAPVRAQTVAPAQDAFVPVGSIMAFAGEFNRENVRMLEAAGWLPCDGRSLRRVPEYLALFRVIQESYGEGYEEPITGQAKESTRKTGDFNVPDCRGRFLRGVDAGANRDPDVSSRLPMRHGGASGDHVGSVQEDALQIHRHQDPGHGHSLREYGYRQRARSAADHIGMLQNYPGERTPIDAAKSNIGDPIDARVKDETRPKNINVNWIIKYR